MGKKKMNHFLRNLLLAVIFFTVTNTSYATDIKNNGMMQLLKFLVIQQQIQFTMLFSNSAWLAAPVRGTVTVRNSSGTTVFEETVQTSQDVQPYTDGTLTTEYAFNPQEPGDYTVQSHVEPVGMPDIDLSNNDWETTITVFQPPPGYVFTQPEGLTISQIDFTFDGAQQQNSSYGLLALDWTMALELSGFISGFLNVATENNWIVQNMPFDFSTGYSGMSTMFNLGTTDDVTSIDLYAHISETPLLTFDLRPVCTWDVGDKPYNAQGVNMPRGNIPAPLPFASIPFVDGGKSQLVWQHGHVNIEADKNQCAPASVANSLQWLENTQNINVPDDHKPGIRDNSLVGKLDTAMNRSAHSTIGYHDMVNGKVKYINSAGLGNNLSIKHKNRKGTNYFQNNDVTFGNATSKANNDTTVSLIDWILAELDSSEDVELVIKWDGVGAHAVDLIGGGYVDGVPWLAWMHDANQGYTDNGTPGNTADDKTAVNGGLSPDSGGVGWSYIINDQIVSVVGGDTSRGKIACAISESKKEPPTSIFGDEGILPVEYYLSQNYPNPFNPTTSISYIIPIAAHVTLTVYDILGKQIAVLVNKVQAAGNYQIQFNSSNFASGTYIYELRSGSFIDSKKMIILK